MPRIEHELLVELIRGHPDLVLALLRSAFGLDLPGDIDVFPNSENLTDVRPAEFHADLVLVLRNPGDPRAHHALVIEVQLRPDARKRFTWPAYIAVARARLECPVTMVVITLDEGTARWCASPIVLDDNASALHPLVLGPSRVPIVDTEGAHRHPELAALSLIAHRDQPIALQLGRALLSACDDLHEARARWYADVALGFVDEAARRVLEAEMNLENYQLRSEVLRKLEQGAQAQGRVDECGRAVLTVLEARGLPVTDAQRERITTCADLDVLEAWLARAVTATFADDIFAG